VAANDSTTLGRHADLRQDDDPSHGSVVVNRDRHLHLTRPRHFNGSDSFTYTVNRRRCRRERTKTVFDHVTAVQD